jgi:type II secretory pathway pseudopilin PulG
MKRNPTQINSFFIEIILVILFFSISVAVTLQLFVTAKNRAQQSSELNVAVIKAENIAEQVKELTAEDVLPQALVSADPHGTKDSTRYRLGYDKQWNPTKSNPRYVMDVTLEKTKSVSGTIVIADIAVSRKNQNDTKGIYQLSAAKYLPSP